MRMQSRKFKWQNQSFSMETQKQKKVYKNIGHFVKLK